MYFEAMELWNTYNYNILYLYLLIIRIFIKYLWYTDPLLQNKIKHNMSLTDIMCNDGIMMNFLLFLRFLFSWFFCCFFLAPRHSLAIYCENAINYNHIHINYVRARRSTRYYGFVFATLSLYDAHFTTLRQKINERSSLW